MSDSSTSSVRDALQDARTAMNARDIETFIALIPQIKDHLDMQDKNGDTFLTSAVEMRSHEAVKALLDAGASVDIQNHKGSTALILATFGRGKNTFDILIEHGADFTIKDQNGNCPLLIAAAFERKYFFDRLLELGADMETVNVSGTTPLIALTLNTHTTQRYIMMADLIDAKCDLDKQDNDGKTALHNVISYDKEMLLTRLIDCGADCVLPDNDGVTPLVCAVREGNTKAFNRLIPRYAPQETDMQDNEGKTALMYAAILGKADFFNALLDAGADIHVRDDKGKTALYHAFENERYDIVRRLIARRATLNDVQIRQLSKAGHLGQFERYYQRLGAEKRQRSQQAVLKRTKRPSLG